MTDQPTEEDPDLGAELETLVRTNAGLIEQAINRGIRPEMLYVMAGLDTIKRVIAGNEQAFLAINCHHERAFQDQITEALQPKLHLA